MELSYRAPSCRKGVCDPDGDPELSEPNVERVEGTSQVVGDFDVHLPRR